MSHLVLVIFVLFLMVMNVARKYVQCIHKRKGPTDMKELLWERGLIGEHSAQVLCDTLAYMTLFCSTRT